MNMNIKQTKTNKNKILKLFLIFVFIFGISFPVNAAPTQLHPEGNPEKQTTFQIQANCTEGEALSYTTEQGLFLRVSFWVELCWSCIYRKRDSKNKYKYQK